MENIEHNEIKSLLINTLFLEEVYVSSNGKHFKIIAIGKIFENRTRIERQKIVYSPLMKYITKNLIHAITIKTYSSKEWTENSRDLQVL